MADSRIPMDAVVGDYMRFRRYIGSKDRAGIAERTYNIVRAHARLGWWLDKVQAADTPRLRVIAWLALGEGKDEVAITRLFDGSKYGPATLRDEEQKILSHLASHISHDGEERDESSESGLIHPDMPEAVRAECPPLYEQSLRGYFGADFAAEMAALIAPAPLDLRVNTWRANLEKVQNYLEAAGVATDPTPYSPAGLRARGKAYLAKTKAFAKGWVEIQDEGSQLIAAVCDAQPGMQVLDYCAGAGGKTLALAAAMQNKGRIVASDTAPRRLEKARPRFRKAGVHDIIEVRALSDEKTRKWLKRQKGTFDIVLADVPCTGTGTWRRNPDMRWRTYGPSLAELVEIQAEILDKVAKTVKPGGRLVYATCSLLPEENEKQIENFLKHHDGFELVPFSVILSDSEAPHAIKPGDPSVVPLLQDDSQKYMRLTPHRHNTDGFFAAVLRRTL